VKGNVVMRVRRDLCTGCGLCADHCPQQAISLDSGWAQIDQERCNQCGRCLDACPRGAITARVPVSANELRTAVGELKGRVQDILARIEGLRQDNG